ncbi:MAG: glucose-1-phosphate cytidylyltransferase [Romboutsia sp.]|uniref:glucose-1-phosphate cytidylyltransferase n=1 Tax=Romboutsia sp. TaxID=1965302 RepID=UPI003F3C324D
MKVVILAGGFGTRLGEETSIIPKPLVSIGEMPIIWHIMKIYSYYGFNDFIICLGYKGNAIKEFFSKLQMYECDVSFDYSNEGKVAFLNQPQNKWKVTLVDTGLNSMTGGRLKRISHLIGKDDFMFTYGDGLANINIDNLIKCHKESNKIASVTAVKPTARFGSMILENNEVKEFKEKINKDQEWINGGFFVANYKIFDYIDDDSCILEQEPLATLAKDGELNAYKHTGFWQPMDILKEKIYLNELWNSNKAPWKVWK